MFSPLSRGNRQFGIIYITCNAKKTGFGLRRFRTPTEPKIQTMAGSFYHTVSRHAVKRAGERRRGLRGLTARNPQRGWGSGSSPDDKDIAVICANIMPNLGVW